MLSRYVFVKEADAEVLRLISRKVDSLLMLCETESELSSHSLKFKLEQAVDKTAFQSNRRDGEEMLHLQRVLQRMVDFGLQIALHILRRTGRQHKSKFGFVKEAVSAETPVSGADSLQRNSSVTEFCDGSDAWLEAGAHMSYTAVELLCLILVSHPRLVHTLQTYMFESGVLDYIKDALSISREQEIGFFQEGYKTEHLRLIANLTHDNPEVCSHVVNNSQLLKAVLTGTCIDEENPGMGEWAKFCIRNLSCCSSEAREKIRRLSAVSISDETKELVLGKVDCQLDHTGRVVVGNLREVTN